VTASPPIIDYIALSPVFIVIAGALVLILAEVIFPRRAWLATALTAAVAVVALFANFAQLGKNEVTFGGFLAVDDFSVGANAVVLMAVLLTALVSYSFMRREEIHAGEYYSLLALSASGMMLMVQSRDLMITFLALEILSIPLYILVGMNPHNIRSKEASLKYFLMGAFASGIFVFGLALVLGGAGTLNYEQIASRIHPIEPGTMVLAGFALVFIALAFKVALVPFQAWTPDVYQGSPLSLVGMMASSVKAAGFAGFLRIIVFAVPFLRITWQPAVVFLAVATMIVGNLLALNQTNLKRLLAYSSISHAGYVCLGLLASSDTAAGPILFYLVGYLFTVIGAFLAVQVLTPPKTDDLEIDDVRGLAREQPFVAALLAVFLISLAGLPPTVGFLAKLYVFKAALAAGQITPVVIAVLMSVVGVYYYLRVVVAMYMTEPLRHVDARKIEARLDPLSRIVVIATAVAVFYLGVFPEAVIRLASIAGLR
jgi:NADH-quinone oxidoreductase subunit N